MNETEGGEPQAGQRGSPPLVIIEFGSIGVEVFCG